MKRNFRIAFLLFWVLPFCSSCFNQQIWRLRRTDHQIRKYVKRQLDLKPQIFYYAAGGKQLRVVVVGDTNKRPLLMVHGSPSSSTEFDMWMKDTVLLSKVYMVIIEKPGYGFSNFGETETNIELVSDLILKTAKNFIHKPYYVLGNSYGGPVAATIAAKDSLQVEKLILSVSAIAPGAERIYGISKSIDKHPGMYPKVFQMANKEKLAHMEELKKLEKYWSSVQAKVYCIHGTKDHLIYFKNTIYVKEHFTKSKKYTLFQVEGAHHPIFWTHTKTVKKFLIQILND